MFNLFFALRVIDFESGICDYYDVRRELRKINPKANDLIFSQEMNKVYNSTFYKLWRMIWKITPNYFFWDKLLTRIVGGHITIFGLTFFGYNAMKWAIQWKYKRYYWLFRPPCFIILGKRGWTWGKLYKSPNGTPQHPEAKIYYGKNSI